jgi:hypothetical protein
MGEILDASADPFLLFSPARLVNWTRRDSELPRVTVLQTKEPLGLCLVRSMMASQRLDRQVEAGLRANK